MKTIYDYIDVYVKRNPEKTAVKTEDQEITYGELGRYSSQFAWEILKDGCDVEDRVIFYSTLSIESTVAAVAVIRSGCTLVTCHPAYGLNVLQKNITDCTPKILITDQPIDENANLAQSSVEKIIFLNHEYTNRSGIDCVTTKEIRASTTAIEINHNKSETLGAIFYTSGTTSDPKGCAVSHSKMISVYENLKKYLNYSEADTCLNYANTGADYTLYNLLIPIVAGGISVPFSRALNGPKDIESMVRKNKVTIIETVPADLYDAFMSDDIDACAYETVRLITSTGQALPESISKRIQKLLPHVELYSMYGCTECKRISYMPPLLLAQKPTSVGIPIPGINLYLVNRAGQIVVTPFEHGELVVASDMVMDYYWGKRNETNERIKVNIFGEERAFFTKDIFFRDEDGYLYFSNRKDEAFKMDTLQIVPSEVEKVLERHRDIREAVIVAKAKDRVGSVPIAFVLRRPDSQLTNSHVSDFCEKNLLWYMRPAEVYIVDSIPRSILGKPDRKKILSDYEHGKFEATNHEI